MLKDLAFSPAALAQVDRIYRHIAARDRAAAQRVINRIYAVAEHVRDNPGGGRATTIRGIRMFVVNPFPYAFIFNTSRIGAKCAYCGCCIRLSGSQAFKKPGENFASEFNFSLAARLAL